MSYDLKIDVLCDHKVIDEDKIVEDDKLTVILNRPLNNTSDIIDRNILYGKIVIQPVKTAEYLLLDFVLQPTGVSITG